MALSRGAPATPSDFREPALATFLFNDPRAGWVWLVVRVLLAVQWLGAGADKIGSPDWTGERAGAGVAAFVNRALTQPGGQYHEVVGWYASFLDGVVLPNAAALGSVIAVAEVAVGLCLLFGAFTGIAAAAGIVLNASYSMAGAIGLDPLMLLAEVLLVVAWRTAGWVGFDRRLLPYVGTPWQPGAAFTRAGIREPLPVDAVLSDHHRWQL